jgi:hypothetical protein
MLPRRRSSFPKDRGGARISVGVVEDHNHNVNKRRTPEAIRFRRPSFKHRSTRSTIDQRLLYWSQQLGHDVWVTVRLEPRVQPLPVPSTR